jgi:hypothetical protein
MKTSVCPCSLKIASYLDPYMAMARSSLGEVAWQKTLVEGRAMMPKQAIEYSLSAEKAVLLPPVARRPGRSSATLAPLTPLEGHISHRAEECRR